MMTGYIKFDKKDLGFTLIEVLISTAIFSVIILAVFYLIISYNKTSDLMADQLALQSEGRNSLEQIVNDLRRTNGGSNGAFAIDSADSDSVVFYTNVDTDSYFEKVEYSIVGTDLVKSVIKPSGNPLIYNPANKISTVITSKIANNAAPLFSYYDNSYTGTEAALALPVDVTAIRLIKINLILDNKPLSPVAPLSVEAKVALRNLKDN